MVFCHGSSEPWQFTFTNPKEDTGGNIIAPLEPGDPYDFTGCSAEIEIIKNPPLDYSQVAVLGSDHITLGGAAGTVLIVLSDTEKLAYSGKEYRLFITYADAARRLEMKGRVQVER